MDLRRRDSAVRAVLAGIAAVFALLFAGLLTSCDVHPVVNASPYVGVCVNPAGVRVADTWCGGADQYIGHALDTAGYAWDYYPPSYTGLIPAYNQPVVSVAIIHTVPPSTGTRVIVIDRARPAGGPSITIRSTAASAHLQATEKPNTGSASTKKSSGGTPSTGQSARTNARTNPPQRSAATVPTTRSPSITRGGLGVPRRTR